MSYKVEIERGEHEVLLGGVMAGWSRQEHDVHLVSTEGHKVFSHKVILSFYSSVLREILNDPMIALSNHTVTIFLPASVSTISSLIKILVKGKLNSNLTKEMRMTEEIKNLARTVGVDLSNCSDEGWMNASGSGVTGKKFPLKKTLMSKKVKEMPKPFKIIPKSLKVRPALQPGVISKSKSKTIEIKEFINEETSETDNNAKPKATRFGNRKSKYLSASGKFACDVCNKEFRRTKNLYKHRRMVHAIKRLQTHPSVEKVIKEEKPEELDVRDIMGVTSEEIKHGNTEVKTENGLNELDTNEMPTDEEIGYDSFVHEENNRN